MVTTSIRCSNTDSADKGKHRSVGPVIVRENWEMKPRLWCMTTWQIAQYFNEIYLLSSV